LIFLIRRNAHIYPFIRLTASNDNEGHAIPRPNKWAERQIDGA
jgi:hypothetical protein